MDLAPFRHRSLTLPELARAVAEAASRFEQGDERVAAVPDERTLRYYQSAGLIDRPLRYEGRVAVYGWRHLLQALAVKALQAEGWTLGRIQPALAGVPDDRLEAVIAAALGGPPAGTLAPRLPGDAAPAPGEAPPAAPAAAPSPRAAAAAEVAPGVWVVVDPALHPDPQAVLTRIARALSPSSGGPR